MRQHPAARRNREQFLSDCLRKALDPAPSWCEVLEVKTKARGSRNGADFTTATVAVELLAEPVWEVTNQTMSDGFSMLWEDRDAHGEETKLSVTVELRDRMLAARKLGSSRGLSSADCAQVLRLAFEPA